MKKGCAWLLAFCMLFSSAAAEMKVGTEQLIAAIIDSISQYGSVWLDYADDSTQFMGGVVHDQNGLPGAGARLVTRWQDVYAVADANGIRYSNRLQYEKMKRRDYGAFTANLPKLTEADGQLLCTVFGDILSVVTETAHVETSNAWLDGQFGSCTQIQLPLRSLCIALDKCVTDNLNKYRTQFDDIFNRNSAFLGRVGIPRNVDKLLNNWQQLNIANLIPVDITVQIRWTRAGEAWKLEASAIGTGLEVHCDGSHVDGRMFAGKQEWVLDSRDLETVVLWARDILRQISPDALEVSFTGERGETRLHAKLDIDKFLAQLSCGARTVLIRNSARAQELMDRYIPLAELFGAWIPDDISAEAWIAQLTDYMCQPESRRADYTNKVLEIDFGMTNGVFSMLVKSPRFRLNAALDESSVDLNADYIVPYSSWQKYERHTFTVQGLWNNERLLINGTVSRNGRVRTRWALTGEEENDAIVLALTANDAWLGTLTMHNSSAELSTVNGLSAELLWSDRSANLYAQYGDEMLNASFRLMDGYFSADIFSEPFKANLLLREENGGGRIRFRIETEPKSRYSSTFALEAALVEGQIMVNAGQYRRVYPEESPDWEVGIDLRPKHINIKLNTRYTQTAFRWTEGMLSVHLINDKYANDASHLIITDVTQPHTPDVNTTQINWIRKHYTDDYSCQYTIHTTVDSMHGWHFEIVDQYDNCAKVNLTVPVQPADIEQLLRLNEDLSVSDPEAVDGP